MTTDLLERPAIRSAGFFSDGVGAVDAAGLAWGKDTQGLFKEFLQARWKGIRPILWGNVMRETQLTRGIYEGTLNINGAISDEGK